MSLSYADVGLPLSTPELEDRLARIHPPDLFRVVDLWQFAGHKLDNLPTPSLPTFPPIKPGVLRWPTGATRPAFFFEVVTQRKVDEIREAVADPMTPHSLVMSDGRTGKTIDALMYLLPFLPLSQFGTDHPVYQDGWLMVLADQRFYWWWKYGDVAAQPATWSTLIGTIAARLGVSITTDTISSAYGTPTEKWVGRNLPMPTILDAVCNQIGHRLVVRLDGTVRTANYVTAGDASSNYVANRHVVSGGLLHDPDIARYVPAQVAVFFASGGGGCCAPPPYVVVKGLLDLPDLTTIYAGGSGVADATGNVYADAIFDGTNAAALDDYATRAATDWYGWRSANTDLVYPGIEPWVPTGYEDFVEWTYQRREGAPYASTTVRRGEFDDLPSGSWEVGDCCRFFVKITGGSDSAGYSGTRVVQAGPNVWVAATGPLPVTFTNNIWRAPSNRVSPQLPAIAADQVVECWRSNTYGPVSSVPQYHCHPFGSQNLVSGLLDSDCNPINLYGRDLYSESASPSPPPAPAPVQGNTTSSPGPGVLRSGTQVRFVTRNVTGGTGPYFVVVQFGDGTQATGDDLLHTYASAGYFTPLSIVFDSATGITGPNPILGGDGQAVLTVLDDPGLAVTGTLNVTTADFDATTDTTPTEVPGLAIPVSEGLTYEFEFVGWSDADLVGGIAVGIDGTCTEDTITFQTVTVPTDDSVPTRREALGDTDTRAGFTTFFIVIRGTIVVAAGGSGNLFPTFAQKISSGTSTLLPNATFRVSLVQPSLP